MIKVYSTNRHGYIVITTHAYRSTADFERRLRMEAGHVGVRIEPQNGC